MVSDTPEPGSKSGSIAAAEDPDVSESARLANANVRALLEADKPRDPLQHIQIMEALSQTSNMESAARAAELEARAVELKNQEANRRFEAETIAARTEEKALHWTTRSSFILKVGALACGIGLAATGAVLIALSGGAEVSGATSLVTEGVSLIGAAMTVEVGSKLISRNVGRQSVDQGSSR